MDNDILDDIGLEKESNQNESEENNEDFSEQEDEDNQENDSQETEQKKNILDKEQMKKKFEQYKEDQKQKGVCYISRIPPYMKYTYLRRLLDPYGIERMYLSPEEEGKRKMRQQKGGNKKRCYTEGWVEFSDKRIAKLTALSLNCQKMINKKRGFYSEDLWCIKYLPKFKWENLTEKFAYDQRVIRDKMNMELNQSKKEHDFYSTKQDVSKHMIGKKRKQLRILNQQNNENQDENYNKIFKVKREIKQQQIIEDNLNYEDNNINQD